MTEVGYIANNTLLKKQVGEKTGIIEEGKAQISKSLSPTPTSSSKDDNSSVGSSGAALVAGPSMGEEGGEKNETVLESAGAPLPATSSNKEVSENDFAFREGRSRNPDSEESKTFGVLVPSVIRISPASAGKTSTEAAVRNSPSVSVVRPRASKTPPQEPADKPQNGKPRPGEEAGKAEAKRRGNDINPSPVGTRGSNGGKQVTKKDEAKRREEAQINFPSRKAKRMPPTSGKIPGMPPQVDGRQAPTQHVQYSNNTGAGARHHHPNRQDPHGHRQHGRGMQSTSITSSVGGTPTAMAGRRAQHTRGLSTGSHYGDTESETSPTIPPTPLFQRLVTEEVQELKAYTRIIEEQNRRVTELEHRTADLEKRLQKKNKENSDLERTLEYRETEWRNKFERLETDRDQQKELVEQEKRMNTKLNYQVVQMEQEIHKFLTRKYPQQRESIGGSMRNVRMIQNEKGSPSLVSGTASKSHSSSSPGRADRKKEFKSPREILENDGRVEVVRKRNISSSLLDFFGMP